MQAAIILCLVFFIMFAATLALFILYIKHEQQEDAIREAAYKRMKDDYEREKKELEELQKKATAGNSDDNDAAVTAMLQNASKKSRHNSK